MLNLKEKSMETSAKNYKNRPRVMSYKGKARSENITARAISGTKFSKPDIHAPHVKVNSGEGKAHSEHISSRATDNYGTINASSHKMTGSKSSGHKSPFSY